MRMVLIVVAGLVGLGLLAMIGLSISSHLRVPELGLREARLLPCPETPNCVSSESDGPQTSTVAPLAFDGSADGAWMRARAAVEAIGSTITNEESRYLRATSSSPLFRFVDDLELRLDEEAGVIHVRSAARVGRSDMGANRKRIERLRQEFVRPQ